jgi:hypothetical protein
MVAMALDPLGHHPRHLRLVLRAVFLVDETVADGLLPAKPLWRTSDPPEDLINPLFDLAWRNQTLTFARKEGDNIDRFEMTLIGDGRADLRFVPSEADRQELAADGIPEPKPFRLTRIAQ